MAFKLVRIDECSNSCSISLQPGLHCFGRNTFFKCDDMRVSRNQGQFEVGDSVTLKALHHNPCFYIKEGGEKKILQQNCSVELNVGDKLGLLPDTYWYGLLGNDTSEETLETDFNGVNDNVNNCKGFDDLTTNKQCDNTELSITQNMKTQTQQNTTQLNLECNNIGDSPSILDVAENGTVEIVTSDGNISKSIKRHSTEDMLNSMKKIKTEPDSEINKESSNTSPTFRDETEPVTVKIEPGTIETGTATVETKLVTVKTEPGTVETPQDKVKTEPVGDLKQQDKEKNDSTPKAGPSTHDQDLSTDKNKDYNQPSPSKPVEPKPIRERCIYGASCYRKNPQHKTEFSHPADSDWGAGARGQCPWGARCRRRDPRHWAAHDHPPGAQPPNARGHGVNRAVQVERHGNIFYVQAHTINFFDDHFEVLDSDDESVDYDYEF